ncbi:PadR family transcriptional regulator [Nocardia cyriacigeorgica]|uniref:PadR family transcriptional regulator n=1 Tax=Nocardia cyriacigeorgica TaxID=135487 RepID=A0A6P1D9Z6_9NOCA|nr:PadR family transcriptional regulator [Nocardia cyriacigeorgica]NEW41919.1 PadR family transcriptional regulator [Nocardia cyriacigeorgica]NEW46439.1 PadR family transcriptional regulator [Nocardia cyriacigeorgica]NEW53050.1 PadR family transcriptional regulator [Nocardia cyriacigeorgica]NEW57054.1 PadR family transcriptional regulator [Nocardia cyriacigeorgica]
MAAKRKVGNLLALAVLSVIVQRPMHRYEIASTLRDRGKDRDMAIKWGSLYTVVQNMATAGFLEIVGSERAGARPERVIYQITDAGRAELIDWTRELIAEPQPEQRQYLAGLSILAALPPDEVIELLGRRLAALDEQIATVRGEFEATSGALPRLFMVETEYGMAMLEAERTWTRSFRDELAAGDFPGLDGWRNWHAEGMNQADVDDLMEGGSQHP